MIMQAQCAQIENLELAVQSSIFLGGFNVQRHNLSRWFANVEIEVGLFVAFGVLLSPQPQQDRRILTADRTKPLPRLSRRMRTRSSALLI
jgi:hypothetical protein